ncbi:MAG: hypothetical protein DRH17_13355 [Deltaproteobacteria bacterium]|nr:MAG: hypothetical protein DRH17_13355 [Deltaproteobacteria bacterium]
MFKRVVFDGATSVIHVVLGFVSKVLALICMPLGWVLAIVYMWYQMLDRDEPTKKLGDFIEFMYGYLLADILFSVV